MNATDRTLTALTADPARSGLFVDFDGTLSHIVDVPSDARPIEGSREVLGQLQATLGVVAIVSGRSAGELVEWLGADLEIWGVHGVERNTAGSIELSDRAVPHFDAMRKIHSEAAAKIDALGLDGIILEDKGVMVALHYRTASDVAAAEAALSAVADDLATTYGLVSIGTRHAFELRPSIDFSKALVVLERSRAAELTAVAFMGDDVVDIPGFEALDELAKEGVATSRIAVNSSEAPDELIRRADLVVEGPAGALDFLQRLTTRLGVAPG